MASLLDLGRRVDYQVHAEGIGVQRFVESAAAFEARQIALGDDEQVYIVLMVENDPDVIGNHGILGMQTNEIVVEGDLYVRDGIKYLAIDTIIDNHGIVNYSHEEFDIQPFGE